MSDIDINKKHVKILAGAGCLIFGLIILMYVLGVRQGAQQKQRDHDLEIAEYALDSVGIGNRDYTGYPSLRIWEITA